MMNPYDEYDQDGTSRAEVWRRQRVERNFVAPTPAPLATRRPQTIDVVPAVSTTTQPADVSAAWQPQQATKETTSAVDRAKGLRIRLTPFALLWAGVGVVLGATVWLVAGTLPGAALLAVLAFAGLTGATYYKLNGQDYDHSGAGVERLRISEAAQLQREQMEHEQELRRMALEAYLQTLERNEGR